MLNDEKRSLNFEVVAPVPEFQERGTQSGRDPLSIEEISETRS
jgi:hypothetical protein